MSSLFAGEDSEYQPLRDEESSSASGDSSDTDFSISSPPPKKTKTTASKPRCRKAAVATTKRQRRRGEREKRTKEVGVERDTVKPSPTTAARTTKPHTERVSTAALASQSSRSTTAVQCLNSPLPAAGCNGTPGLGTRRKPHWAPPGERELLSSHFLMGNFLITGPAGRGNLGDSKVATSGGGTPVIRVGLSRNARVKPLHNKRLLHHS